MTPEEFERMIDSGDGKPYVTTADDGYFVCDECMEDIRTGDFIVRPRLRIRGDRTAHHWDCNRRQETLRWAIEENKKRRR